MFHLLMYYLGQGSLKLCIPKKFVRFSTCYSPLHAGVNSKGPSG